MLDGVCIRTIRGTYAWYLVHLLTKSAEEALGFAHGMTFTNFDRFQPLQHVGSIRWPCAWCTSLVRAWQPWGSAILSTRHFSTCFYDWLVSKSSLTEPVQPSPDRHKAALFSHVFSFCLSEHQTCCATLRWTSSARRFSAASMRCTCQAQLWVSDRATSQALPGWSTPENESVQKMCLILAVNRKRF